jgi:hypothetical protein
MFRPIRIKSAGFILADIKAHISGFSMVLTGLATDAGSMIDRSVHWPEHLRDNVVNLIGMVQPAGHAEAILRRSSPEYR